MFLPFPPSCRGLTHTSVQPRDPFRMEHLPKGVSCDMMGTTHSETQGGISASCGCRAIGSAAHRPYVHSYIGQYLLATESSRVLKSIDQQQGWMPRRAHLSPVLCNALTRPVILQQKGCR